MEVCRIIWFEKYELDILHDSGCLTSTFGSRAEITKGSYLQLSEQDLIKFSKKLEEYSGFLWNTNLDSKVGEADTAYALSRNLSNLISK